MKELQAGGLQFCEMPQLTSHACCMLPWFSLGHVCWFAVLHGNGQVLVSQLLHAAGSGNLIFAHS